MQISSELSSFHRFSSQYKSYMIYQYKIADQNQQIFKLFDQQNFQGLGLCGLLCLSVVQILSENFKLSIKQLLINHLRNQKILIQTGTRISEKIKKHRSEYFRSHRYEFGKDALKTSAFMKSVITIKEIENQLLKHSQNNQEILFINVVKKGQSKEPDEEYLKEIYIIEKTDRVYYFHLATQITSLSENLKKKIMIGITIDDNNHYVSFVIENHNLHLFNTLDQPSFQCDTIKMLIRDLELQQNESYSIPI